MAQRGPSFGVHGTSQGVPLDSRERCFWPILRTWLAGTIAWLGDSCPRWGSLSVRGSPLRRARRVHRSHPIQRLHPLQPHRPRRRHRPPLHRRPHPSLLRSRPRLRPNPRQRLPRRRLLQSSRTRPIRAPSLATARRMASLPCRRLLRSNGARFRQSRSAWIRSTGSWKVSWAFSSRSG